jgi:hypothetical protein
MPLAVKRAMDIRRGVKVGVRFKLTHGTKEEFSPFLHDALACSVGEPLPLRAASRAVLGCPMCIDLHGNDLVEVGFLASVLIDFAAQLIGTSAVHAPRFAALPRLDLAQAFKEQDAARIASADLGNLTGDLVGGIFIETVTMPPEVTVTMFAFDWPARLPLLFGDPFEMAVAVGVQTMIGHKDGLDNALL